MGLVYAKGCEPQLWKAARVSYSERIVLESGSEKYNLFRNVAYLSFYRTRFSCEIENFIDSRLCQALYFRF